MNLIQLIERELSNTKHQHELAKSETEYSLNAYGSKSDQYEYAKTRELIRWKMCEFLSGILEQTKKEMPQ